MVPCAGDTAKGVAVTVGVSYTEYYLNSAHQQMTAYSATSGTLSVICGRLSFTLALKVSLTGHAVSGLQAGTAYAEHMAHTLYEVCIGVIQSC